jgi:hypothetical protein
MRPGLMQRRTRLLTVAEAATTFAALAGCGRSGSSASNPPSRTPTGSASASSAAAGPGDFGDLKAICGPGHATGGSGRGISATAIKVGTMADPGRP